MDYKVIVIGAGPAGIFASLTLADLGIDSVLLLEQGKDLNLRKHDNPEDRLCGWGGAGAYSDGKLTLSTDVGGVLNQFIEERPLIDLLKATDEIYGQPEGSIMAIREVLLLGNPKLYEKSDIIRACEVKSLHPIVSDLHDTLMDFRQRYGAGRAIAAPQIGVMKRLIYMSIDGSSTVFINPQLEEMSEETMEVWDDCLCFPDLLVKVKRHRSCRIRFMNQQWEEESIFLEDDLSELLQHEYDHLDGVLAVSRAIDGKSFALRGEQ